MLIKTINTSITSCEINSSTRFIYSSAFYECTSLTSITIPSSVTSIGDYAFYDCTSLTSVTIPNSVTTIGSSAFSGCTALTEIKFNATAMDDLSSWNYVFYNAGKDGDGIKVIIGKNVTKIPAYLFYPHSSSYSPKITSVEFEEGSVCTSIGSCAFRYCRTLTSITIPNSVTSIGSYAFSNCTSLTSVTIPSSVTSIGSCAFRYCRTLTSITFAEGSQLTTIGSYAFEYCTSLESITFAEGSQLTSIGSYAFRNCTSLTSVSFVNTDGWWYSSSSSATSGTAIASTDLEDASAAATYLTATYVDKYWYRTVTE